MMERANFRISVAGYKYLIIYIVKHGVATLHGASGMGMWRRRRKEWIRDGG